MAIRGLEFAAWRRELSVALAVVGTLVVVGIAHAPALSGGFIWDDHVLLERPQTAAPLRTLFTKPFWPDTALADGRPPYYRPLVHVSYRIDHALGGGPFEYHFTNLLLHLVATALLVVVALRYGARPARAIPLALLWGMAPRLTEAVAWISGRTDVLACVFGLAAFAAVPGEGSRARRARWVITALALFCAMASKEVGVAFAVGVGAMPFLHGRRPTRADVPAATAAVVPLAGYLVLRTLALASTRGPERTHASVKVALATLGTYVEMTFDALRPRTAIGSIERVDTLEVVLGGLVLAGATFAIIRHRLRLPFGARVAILVGALTLAMTLHIVPLALAGGLAADRLLYVPLAALVLVTALTPLPRRVPWPAGAIVLVIVSALMLRATRERAAHYANEVLFWTVATESADPFNVTSRNALASAVRDHGYPELSCRLLEISREVLRRVPASALTGRRTLENLQGCWALVGRYDDALALATELARDNPRSGRIQMGLGFARLHKSDFEGARKAFADALTLDRTLRSTVDPALMNVGVAAREDERYRSETERRGDPLGHARHLARVGRLPEAEEAFRRIVEDDSASYVAQKAGVVFLVEYGRFEAAERAIAIRGELPNLQMTDVPEKIAQRRMMNSRMVPLVGRVEALSAR